MPIETASKMVSHFVLWVCKKWGKVRLIVYWTNDTPCPLMIVLQRVGILLQYLCNKYTFMILFLCYCTVPLYLMNQTEKNLVAILSNLTWSWEYATTVIEAIQNGKISGTEQEQIATLLLDAAKKTEMNRRELEISITRAISESIERLEKSEKTLAGEMFNSTSWETI